ncbi:hypothetical protein [Candidatus Nitrosocosmicus franklandus]|uniref:hypothetical protein n=1 Tax=Candidatus Nitrosocosmicus franklandianus TaxID=1798806 RepID=UPI00106A3F4C|nr:hypothetical protein [Candidatus Nitrosocosmicus franklandus]
MPLIIGLVMFFVLYSYSRLTTPGQEIFLSSSLYQLAQIVMASFLITLAMIYFSIHRFFFSKSRLEKDPKALLYHLQHPLQTRRYKLIFIGATLAYFVFFGFLSNIFIYFTDAGTIFSLVPLPSSNHSLTEEGSRMEHSSIPHLQDTNNNIQSNNNEISSVVHQNLLHDNSSNFEINSGSINNTLDRSIPQNQDPPITTFQGEYPSSQLIICCNTIGYVPMLILKLTDQFSILIIPLNLLIATTLSTLVGLNTSLNIYLLSKRKSVTLSKKNFLGVLGISTGLFVGCPTCTGSLFYSLVGFSSLILFSSLNFYQIIFVAISIPMLFISLIIMMRVLQKSFLNTCKL